MDRAAPAFGPVKRLILKSGEVLGHLLQVDFNVLRQIKPVLVVPVSQVFDG